MANDDDKTFGSFIGVDPIYQNAGDPNLAPLEADGDSDEAKLFEAYVEDQDAAGSEAREVGQPGVETEAVDNPTIAEYVPPSEDGKDAAEDDEKAEAEKAEAEKVEAEKVEAEKAAADKAAADKAAAAKTKSTK